MTFSKKEYERQKAQFILDFKEKRGKVSLKKETSNLFRQKVQSEEKIDVSAFNKVITVDLKRKIVQAGGMTTYDDLTKETLKYGFMPAVVPQLKTITIGGAVTGLGIESSSFRYGLVHETVEEMEIVLADSSVVTCTPNNKYKDLFFAFPNSYGTLGYALSVSVKLIPVKKYVHIQHVKFSDSKLFFAALQDACKKKYDFVDGSVFGCDEMYISLGTFCDKAPYRSDYTYMLMYYQSIQDREEDYLETYDYLWRWDTDWFWCSKHFGVQNLFIRMLFGRRFLNSKTYSKIRRWSGKYKVAERLGKIFGAKRTETIIQDVDLPIEKCVNFFDFFVKHVGILPFWVCPTKLYDGADKWTLYPMGKGLYVNFGFWDVKESENKEWYYNRLIEKEVKRLGGVKSLYSTVHYPKKEFWELYNGEEYFALKQKYDPSGRFLTLYEKCTKAR